MHHTRLPTDVHGWAAEGFEQTIEIFRGGNVHPTSTGAAFALYRDGREVVNIWMGTADHRTGAPWQQNTLQVIFSASKGLTALVLARLHEAKELDLLRPIGGVWPEFAAHGKGEVTIADVMAHRAGVSAPIDTMTLDEVLDSRAFATRIAEQPPLWLPGTAHAYHAITFGTIAQELVRRVTGRELHEVFADEIAGPLDADVSLRADEDDLARIARIVTTPEWDSVRSGGSPADDEWIGRALTLGAAFPRSLVDGDAGFNDPRVLLAGVAGAGGVGTAAGLARIWSAVVVETDGVRLLDSETLALLTAVRSEGPWHFDPGPPHQRWGAGVQLSSDVTPWFGAQSFGHDGAGGQSGMADPQIGIGLGYVTNRMSPEDRVAPLISSLRT